MRYLLFLSVATGLCACTDRQTGSPVPMPAEQHAYFPLEKGRYVVYQVDSVVYDFAPDGSGIRDSSSTFVMEWVGDTLRDNTGALVYAIERYERKNPGDPWMIRRVETAGRNEQQAIRTEDNQRFLKLVFPLSPFRSWDGNLWIDTDQEVQIAGERIRPFTNWSYRVERMDQPETIGAFAFDSVLTIREADDTNLFERRYVVAQYAKNVGLVRREQWILDSQYCNRQPTPADCPTRPWEEKAEKGYILRQTVLTFN